MHLDFTPEQRALRQQIRDYYRTLFTPELRTALDAELQDCGGPVYRQVVRRMGADGWLGIGWPKEYGGQGRTPLEQFIFWDETYRARAPLPIIAINTIGPTIMQFGTDAQKNDLLPKILKGQLHFGVGYTEPGAGTDLASLTTRAVRDGDDYVIDGGKWFITGAEGAAFAIVMANVSDVGATMFLSDMNASGIVLERTMGSLDSCFPGGHGVVRFEGLRVPAADVLGEVGKGFKYAQVRLSPARLTHCMRWLGAARRAHDVAVDYARRRQAFGKPIGEHEGVGFMIADNDMDLHVARLAIWHCAWVLDHGELGLHESSRAKVIVSEATWRVVDRCVQILGGQGVTDETVVARIFADLRAFRIYDGPSEVHRFSIAKRILRGKVH